MGAGNLVLTSSIPYFHSLILSVATEINLGSITSPILIVSDILF